MNQKEYNALAEKTLSTNFHVNNQKEKNLLHAVMGLVTESVELIDNYDGTKPYDSTNVFEEIGDGFWYLSVIQREFQFNYDWNAMRDLPHFSTKQEAAISLIKKSNALLDYHKKLVFYGKKLDVDKYLQMSLSVAQNFMYFVHQENFDWSDVNDRNIAKLKARYGDKFNEEGALNRDLSNERAILEKSE